MTVIKNGKELCKVEYKSGKTESIELTPEQRTLLILSCKQDPIMVCVPLQSKVQRYRGMHCTLINERKKAFA